jgi:hypothetical protein
MPSNHLHFRIEIGYLEIERDQQPAVQVRFVSGYAFKHTAVAAQRKRPLALAASSGVSPQAVHSLFYLKPQY